MGVLVVFSFLAGVVTVLSPCILPVLPIILAGAVGGGRARPWGIITGFVASFTFFTLALSTLVRSTGLSGNVLRLVAVVLLALFGIFLLVPALQLFFDNLISRILPQQHSTSQGKGFWPGILVGISLGLVWTPCVGPIMAAVIALAASSDISLTAVFITLAYALGTAVPMLAIMFGGRRFLDRASWVKAHAGHIQRGFGLVMVLVAIVLYKDYDRTLQSLVLARFPNYGSGLTALENNSRVAKALGGLRGEDKGLQTGNSVGDRYPQAPELIPGGEWLNSQPLSLQSLRGKVVLVDFWTYTCINCIRTLPALNAWHERYADKGLVIIGVHTPEFEFEKDSGNVSRAIRDLGVKYPVVQDNNYATWNAYNNRYWPAKYFIDKGGRIRATHFGEGNEEESEKIIRSLLKEAGSSPGAYARSRSYSIDAQTPETYLGLDRTEGFSSPERLGQGTARYSRPQDLAVNSYAYEGEWSVASEYASPKAGARLDFHF